MMNRNRLSILAAAALMGVAIPRARLMNEDDRMIPDRRESATAAAAPAEPERPLTRQQRRAAERRARKTSK